jgi:alpha-N-acetylglucosamine transferase
MINIVCVLRQGGKVGYDASWVEKLKNSVSRNLKLPHQFICLSDCDVNCERIPLTDTGVGFWSKLELFKPGQFSGPVLYIDLDTVICESIDEIINLCKDQQFVMWIEKDKDIHSSALMYWNGDHSYLWDIYKSKPLEYWRELYAHPPLYGDQAIISENTIHKTFLELCPDEWFHIASKKDSSLDLSKVKMLMFRKVSQKPSTMLSHTLVEKNWK